MTIFTPWPSGTRLPAALAAPIVRGERLPIEAG